MASKMGSVKTYAPRPWGAKPKMDKPQAQLMVEALEANDELNEDQLFLRCGIKCPTTVKTKANKILKPKGKIIKQRRVMINTNLFDPNRKSLLHFWIEDIKK